MPAVALTKEPCLICARRLRAALHRLVGVQPSLCRATPQRLRKQADRTDVGGLAEAPPLSHPLVHCGDRQNLPTPEHVAVMCVPALHSSRTRISPNVVTYVCVRAQISFSFRTTPRGASTQTRSGLLCSRATGPRTGPTTTPRPTVSLRPDPGILIETAPVQLDCCDR